MIDDVDDLLINKRRGEKKERGERKKESVRNTHLYIHSGI